MKKTIMTFILVITLLLAVMPVSVFALSGAGTQANPYIISSAADLTYVKDNLSAYYKLNSNIVLTSEWTPIGSEVEPFAGVFDGDGFSISGLNISESASTAVVGLFGYNNGEIKNLTVNMGTTGLSVSANNVAYVGGIVAYNISGTIINCRVEGDIEVTASTTDNMSNIYAGLVAGRSSGPVKNSSAIGSVTATVLATEGERTTVNPAKIYAGGLIGLSTANQEFNFAAVDVTAAATSQTGFSSSVVYAGGLAGENTAEIINTYAAGNVSVESDSTDTEASAYAGGLIGKNSGTLTYTNASGNVAAQTDSTSARTYSGGLTGYNTGSVSESFATGIVNAQSTTAMDTVYAGGLIGLSGGEISKCYAVGAANATAASVNSIEGGLVGYAAIAATDSYYLNSASYPQLNGCGTPKTEAQLKLQATFAGWDFVNTWNISETRNSGYPYLVATSSVEVVFTDAEYTYDGTEKTITASYIESGATVEYVNNKATDAGVYNAVAIVTAQNHATTIVSAKLTILPKKLQVTGLKANDKEFDNTTAATLDGSQVVLVGVVSGDDVQLDVENVTAHFQSKTVGDNKRVIIEEMKFKGADAHNYSANPVELYASIFEGSFGSVEFEGSGTISDPYIIYDEDELNAIRGNLNAHFKLANDIILQNEWLPIGRAGYEFKGSFDGDGYEISGLSIAPDTNYRYSGLFGYNEGRISNLTVYVEDAIYTNASNLCVGAIAGYNAGTITNCTSSGSIITNPISTYIYVGGIAGVNAGTITYCESTVDIDARGSAVYAGGVVGENKDTIETTGAKGTVTVQDSLAAYVGGFAGNNIGTILNCYSIGDATIIISDVGFDADVGGFAGRVEGGTITNSYSAGVPSITLDYGAHLLTGQQGGFTAYNDGVITECYYDLTVSGMSDIDKGIPKTSSQLKIQSTYQGWDFTIWRLSSTENNGYPYIMRPYIMDESAVVAYNKDNREITVTAFTDIIEACLIAASFNAGTMIDYVILDEHLSIANGASTTRTIGESFDVREGGSIKIMLWQNLVNIKPLSAFAQAEIR
ncbi:MAG: GLUG motif-containing protein [Monoglobales bacterium]